MGCPEEAVGGRGLAAFRAPEGMRSDPGFDSDACLGFWEVLSQEAAQNCPPEAGH